MKYVKYKFIVGLVAVFVAAGMCKASQRVSVSFDEIQPPELPPICSALQIGDESVVFRAYAIGVQIYRWNGASWDFVAPSANLYADEGYHGRVATHYAGPTWESNSGSRVVGRKVKDCAPYDDSIPWLLLEEVSTDGPGVFRRASHIQRVNTTGGLKPPVAGSIIGEMRRVPYTAEYFFYGAGE